MDIGLPLTFLYPAAVKDVDLISFTAQRVKIARHSYCTACTCRGMHPPNGWTVITDDSEDAPMVIEQSEDLDELTDDGYMQICSCGHGFPEHGADEGTDASELRRKAKVAVQIDVLLEVNIL